jgi:hypothetical protein
MSKFNNIVKETLNTTNLTKIQIKTDPATDIDTLPSMKHAKSYTGYLLEEEPDDPIIINLDDIIGDPMEMPQPPTVNNEPINDIKHDGILYLLQKGLIKNADIDKIQELESTQTIGELETALRDYNITDTEILSLYRDYFKPKQCPCHAVGGI